MLPKYAPRPRGLPCASARFRRQSRIAPGAWGAVSVLRVWKVTDLGYELYLNVYANVLPFLYNRLKICVLLIDNIRIALYAQIWRKPNLPCSSSLNLPRIYLLPLTSLRRSRIIRMIVYLSFSPIFICKLLKISGFGNYRIRLLFLYLALGKSFTKDSKAL